MRGRPSIGPALAAALLAASACSPSPAASEQEAPAGTAAKTVAEPTAQAARAPPSRAAAVVPAAPKGERRCGWLINPTPANWWLTDRDGEWILSIQGGEGVDGMEDMPDMTTAGWVETNGHYGYGCACMTITHDPATKRVTRIADAEPKPLKQCRADKALPAP